MKNRSLRTKLIASFLSITIVTMAIGIMGWRSVKSLDRIQTNLTEDTWPSADSLMEMSSKLKDFQIVQRTMLDMSMDMAARQAALDQIQEVRKQYGESRDDFESLPMSPEEKANWDAFLQQLEIWKAKNNESFAMYTELNKRSIVDPDAMLAEIRMFKHDHSDAMREALEHIVSGEPLNTTQDASTCPFGKWSMQVDTENQVIRTELDRIRTDHDSFHAAISEIKEALKAQNKDKALEIYQAKLNVSAEKAFGGFEKIDDEISAVHDLAIQFKNKTTNESFVAQAKAIDLLENGERITMAGAAKEMEQARMTAKNSIRTNIIGMIVGCSLAMGLGLFLSNSITRSLTGIINSLNEGSKQVASAASQVNQSSQSMAEGASESASSLEETSSALEELASMTRQNADNSRQANQVAKEAACATDTSQAAMIRMSGAITKIKDSSDKTAKINKTIDEIAFQTNLLALNAAVEAARAGEAGKGFAVVAEEVRSLALRSAQAARDTSELIQQAVADAENGVMVGREVEDILNQIADKVKRVTQLAGEVSAASDEQAKGIEQINSAVNEMDRVTQTNAANAEESASASEELNAQADELASIVGSLVGLVHGRQGKDQNMTAKTANSYHALGRYSIDGNPEKNKPSATRKQPIARISSASKPNTKHAEDIIPLELDDMGDF